MTIKGVVILNAQDYPIYTRVFDSETHYNTAATLQHEHKDLPQPPHGDVGVDDNSKYSQDHEAATRRYQYMAYTCSDLITEKTSAINIQNIDQFLGLLQSIGALSIYGYLTNTKIKLLLFVLESSPINSKDIKQILRNIHLEYISLVCNPFYNTSNIPSKGTNYAISTIINNNNHKSFNSKIDKIIKSAKY